MCIEVIVCNVSVVFFETQCILMLKMAMNNINCKMHSVDN